jgi:enamine deaminase RidA (YjgF/YER057c/UK114 family)
MPTERQRIASGGPWEDRYGYSRAIRSGNLVSVAGTTAANADGSIHGEGDAYAQALRCFETISTALAEAGGTLEDVVRTRMFITDPACSDAVGRAHGETFAAIRPAATMVVVAALIDPRLLVEIEVDAVLLDERDSTASR